MHTLFFKRTDDTLDHAVLLRAVRRDEFLKQTVASLECSIAATAEHKSVVGPKQKWIRYSAQRVEASNEGMF